MAGNTLVHFFFQAWTVPEDVPARVPALLRGKCRLVDLLLNDRKGLL